MSLIIMSGKNLPWGEREKGEEPLVGGRIEGWWMATLHQQLLAAAAVPTSGL